MLWMKFAGILTPLPKSLDWINDPNSLIPEPSLMILRRSIYGLVPSLLTLSVVCLPELDAAAALAAELLTTKETGILLELMFYVIIFLPLMV